MAKNARQFSFNLLTYNYMVSFQNESEYFKIETKAIKGIDPEKREAALETIIIIPNSHIVSDKVRLVLSDKKSKMLVGEKIICQLLIDSSGSIKGIKYIIPNKVFQLLTAQDFDIIDRLLRETLNFEIGDESVPYMMPGIKIEL
ncbi:hypothetical protein [Alistipes sp.]|uniref:hypothetical protein n=1 Tax=Alistipes sp. TaxID=1872444 RepID=UPI0025BC0896|nr:hypothetical protein [Alistipes sp.]